MYTLYADGIHDDTFAIQELLDSGISEVILPPTKKYYCISQTLKIHSNQTLRLGETTIIRLLPHSDCVMLTNAEKDAHDICICGGIWDYDNVNQRPNPAKAEKGFWQRTHADGDFEKPVNYDVLGYLGCIMSFDHVVRFSIRDLTLKNPVTFCLRMAYMQYFTVENVRFDQNLGNPTAENMDGVHIDGGCRYGTIRNVQGTCYDDIVALNANDCYDGPITDIEVDGVFGDHSLRGVRLLSTSSLVSGISISNVYGTFYQNCIGITFFYPKTGRRGNFGSIYIRNIRGCNAPRIPEYGKGKNYTMPFIWVDGALDIDMLVIENVSRTESIGLIPTIGIDAGTNIHRMQVANIYHQNELDTPLPLMVNKGNIENLYLYNLEAGTDEILANEGSIDKLCEF